MNLLLNERMTGGALEGRPKSTQPCKMQNRSIYGWIFPGQTSDVHYLNLH